MPIPTFDEFSKGQGGGGIPSFDEFSAGSAPKDQGSHPLDSIGHGISEFWNQVNPVSQLQGTAEAIRHPVAAAKSLGQGNADIWNKAKSAYDSGDYLGAIRHGVNYALNGIPGLGSSIENASDKFGQGDYAGGTGASLGIGTNLVVGSKAPEIVSDVMSLPAKIAGKTELPERMYQSALKPSTKLTKPQRQEIIQTGLKEQVPVSAEGSRMASGKINEVNQAIADTISPRAAAGDTIDPRAVASRVDQVRPTFSNQVNPKADLSALDASKQEFLDGPGAGPIPVDMAQDIKQGTYKQIRKSYGQLSNAQVEGQKALARGIKEELAAKYPELNTLNARDGGLLKLHTAIDKAVARIDNHQLFGIGTPLAAAGGAAVTGSPVAGLAIGAARAMLDQPAIKSSLAIALRRAANRPMMTAAGITPGQAVRGAAMGARFDPLQLQQYIDPDVGQ